MRLRIGQRATDFTLPDQFGKPHRLSDERGRWVLLYFYPKDDTPGCTVEACTIRDRYGTFRRSNVVVLGVSIDSVRSHAAFAAKYRIPFPLLADEGKRVVRAYGVWGKNVFMGRSYLGTKRTSFLINPQGRIAKIYVNVQPATHAAEVLVDRRSS